MVAEHFPEVKVVRNDRNIGFAAGMNAGMDVSRGGLFLALNPDTVIPPGSIRKLLTFMNEHPQAGAAGAVLTYADGSLQTSTFRFPSLFREFWNFFPEVKAMLRRRPHWNQVTDVQKPRDSMQVDCVNGAAMITRTDSVRQIGGFDGGFFLYHEEMDLCTRLRKAGWEVWSVPQAQVIHLDARSSGYRRNRLPGLPLLAWRVAGMDRLWQKHKSPKQHRLWRAQARGLLRLRIVLLGGGFLFSKKYRARVMELMQVVKMLGNKAESREQRAEGEKAVV